ncbi:MAG TPA: DUF5753 domain-containing protein [Streptosporangiaceae bacterium]|nr:DUF5753 domain-containing protein [Streptosporangiaceae bacterium]
MGKHHGRSRGTPARATERTKSGFPEWFMPYRLAEAKAEVLRCWSPVVVPAILQTDSYARAQLSVENYTPERLEELVTARMERQEVIGRAHVTAVIDEHVLAREIGSPAVMAEQMGYLGDLATRHNVAVYVIPHRVNMGLWGSFEVASGEGTVTVLLWAIEDIPSTAPSLVAKVTQAYEHLLGAALPRGASLETIRTAEEAWKAQM